jgi:hypothetical protein
VGGRHHPEDVPVADVPSWLLALLQRAAHSGARAGPAPPVGDRIPDGERNGTLTSLAGSMGRRGMGVEEIVAALVVSNAQRCDPPLPEEVVRTIAASVGRYAPAQGPSNVESDPESIPPTPESVAEPGAVAADPADPAARRRRPGAPMRAPRPRPVTELPRPRMAMSLAVHTLFPKHYGARYDTGALNAVLAAAATTFLPGDPVWLLVIGGSGRLKTETVTAARLMPGATATSTITSVGALLSGTAHPQRAKDATGGLLKRVGNPGLLLIKDVSSILSMNRDARALVLAALREVYDGSWIREVGTDGGRTIPWQGRLVVIGAVTTAWDHAHAVIAAMGDRFVLVRLDTNDPDTRDESGRRAMANVGAEGEIREEVATAVAALLAAATPAPSALPRAARQQLLALANFVTRARTAVETDYRGDVITAHALEMPTRFLKQLVQLVRGARRVGLPADRALALALRCAVDSIPPLRLAVCLDLLAGGPSKAGEVAARLVEDTRTVARVLGGLSSLRVVHRELVPEPIGFRGQEVDVSYYSLRPIHVPILTQIASLTQKAASFRGGKVEEGREGRRSTTSGAGSGGSGTPTEAATIGSRPAARARRMPGGS